MSSKVFSTIITLFYLSSTILFSIESFAESEFLNTSSLLEQNFEPTNEFVNSDFDNEDDLENISESDAHDIPYGIVAEPKTKLFLSKPLELISGIRNLYPHVDPLNEISSRPLEMALSYFHQLKNQLKATQYLGVIDYHEHSTKPRFFLINIETGKVEKFLVAHGKNSDPSHSGFATIFSNIKESKQSSIGAFLTGETYESKKVGYARRIDGIEPTNSRVRQRGVVIHGSKYVKPNRNPIGRSWGCPAVDNDLSESLINKIEAGTLFYAWYNQ